MARKSGNGAMTEGSDILTLERRVAGDGDPFITSVRGPVRPMTAFSSGSDARWINGTHGRSAASGLLIVVPNNLTVNECLRSVHRYLTGSNRSVDMSPIDPRANGNAMRERRKEKSNQNQNPNPTRCNGSTLDRILFHFNPTGQISPITVGNSRGCGR